MLFGISMRPLGWAVTLTVVGLTIYLPFLAAERTEAFLPAALAVPVGVFISYLCVPFVLCFLHDRHALSSEKLSIFFYLYKWFYLFAGVGALAYWGLVAGGMEAGFPVLGGLMTFVGLMVFFVSWRSDKRHEREAEGWEDRADAPLDDKTEAILAAAQARAAKPAPRVTSMPLSLGESH